MTNISHEFTQFLAMISL